MRKSDTRNKIIRTSKELFYKKGLNNVGINEIIKFADVAKMTLYHYFESKGDLVLETLQDYLYERQKVINQALVPEKAPIERIDAFFSIACAAERAEHFRGCVFLNAALQTADPTDEVHELVRSHKTWIRDRIKEGLFGDLPDDEAESCAQQVLILWDGAITEAYIQRNEAPIAYAQTLARAVVAAANPERVAD